MNTRKILIITILFVFLIIMSTVTYSMILKMPNQNNDTTSLIGTHNNTNNSTNITNTNPNNNNNPNNQQNTTNIPNTNNNIATPDTKDESPYQTPDGKPRTDHPQSGYSEARQSMNEYSDYVDREGKYDPWTMGKYETNDGNVLYFNRK